MPFDVVPLRALPDKLGSGGKPTGGDDARQALRKLLEAAKVGQGEANTDSPAFQLVDGYTAPISPACRQAFSVIERTTRSRHANNSMTLAAPVEARSRRRLATQGDLQPDEAAVMGATGNSLVAVREKWKPETTARNLALIRAACATRGDEVAWASAIEQALDKRAAH